jgi:hypothetical protein
MSEVAAEPGLAVMRLAEEFLRFKHRTELIGSRAIFKKDPPRPAWALSEDGVACGKVHSS